MNPSLITSILFLRSKINRKDKSTEVNPNDDQKKEIEKINNMGLFSAINYLTKK